MDSNETLNTSDGHFIASIIPQVMDTGTLNAGLPEIAELLQSSAIQRKILEQLPF